MKKYFLLLLIILGDGFIVFSQNGISKISSDFLQEFIEIAKNNSINKTFVDWNTLENKIFDIAKNAKTPEDTYEAIKYGIKMINDGHSFFMTAKESLEWKNSEKNDTMIKIPGPIPYGKIIDSIGYINLPWFDSGNNQCSILFADTLQSVVKYLDEITGLKGWIIDLRDNLGGNNWPMLAGIGSLYETNKIGEFVYPDGKRIDWIYQNGSYIENDSIIGAVSIPYKLQHIKLPIAILTNNSTASSGETVLISFIGSKTVRTFGTKTRGKTTCNELFPMSDGANLLLSTSVYADRNGLIYTDSIVPDELVDLDGSSVSNYIIFSKAIDWIDSQYCGKKK